MGRPTESAIPRVVGANRTGVLFRDVEANGAKPRALLQFLQGDGQLSGLVVGRAKQEERQARCRLRPDARQTGESVNEPLYCARQHRLRHGLAQPQTTKQAVHAADAAGDVLHPLRRQRL